MRPPHLDRERVLLPQLLGLRSVNTHASTRAGAGPRKEIGGHAFRGARDSGER